MPTAIDWSPQTCSPGRGRPAVAHSIGPNLPWSRTSRNPFPHFDNRSAAECGFDDQPVHEAAGTGQAETQSAPGRISVLHRALDVGDAGTLVLGAYHQRLAALPVGHRHPNRTATGIAGDIACDFREIGRAS